MARQRLTVERVSITKVGVWYLVAALVVVVAAVNTGNNALFLVEGGMLALLGLSGLISRRNLRKIDLEPGHVGEVYARTPLSIGLRVTNRDSWMSRRFLEISAGPHADRLVVPFLPKSSSREERLAFRFPRRGLQRLPGFRVLSLFPLGLFQKAMKHHHELEILVYPEILVLEEESPFALGSTGEESSPRQGSGHDLYALRHFRDGDDPRGIHWKRTARTGELIFMERESDEGRRMIVLLDNAVGPLADEAAEERFEQVVSEAASTAVDYLDRGFEVALATRDESVEFGRGGAQRRRILEVLALAPVLPFDATPLSAVAVAADDEDAMRFEAVAEAAP